MNKVYLFIGFLLINFSSLAIGNYFMGDSINGIWYSNLDKAPWTPPGFVFGLAWSLIMFCFSWYLAELFTQHSKITLWILYGFQVLLNTSWNWFFFNNHQTSIAVIVLLLLLLILFYLFITYRTDRLKNGKYLLLPYIIWLGIALSLNTYILIHN